MEEAPQCGDKAKRGMAELRWWLSFRKLLQLTGADMARVCACLFQQDALPQQNPCQTIEASDASKLSVCRMSGLVVPFVGPP